jgi:hypothetical protein
MLIYVVGQFSHIFTHKISELDVHLMAIGIKSSMTISMCVTGGMLVGNAYQDLQITSINYGWLLLNTKSGG